MAWKRIWHKDEEDALFAVMRTSSEAEALERWDSATREITWSKFVGHRNHHYFYDTINSGMFTSKQEAIGAEKKLFKGK
jgi:hypothetical protein